MSERVLLLVPNWLGDAVMALPAIGDVARHVPSSRLIVAGRPAVASLFGLVEAVHEVIVLSWRGRSSHRAAFRDDVRGLRRGQFDRAILFTNSFATAWLAWRTGIPHRWGYAGDMRRALLSRAIERPRGSLHQGAYYQHLVRELGMANGPLAPSLMPPVGVVTAAHALLREHGWNGLRPVVVLAPGAAYGTAKRWPPTHFAAVAQRLTREMDAHVIMVGSAADADTTWEIMAALDADAGAHVTDLAGRTSLEMLVGVLALASACVSNDSGAMHLAAAIGIPLTALFGPTRESETAPIGPEGRLRQVLVNPVACRPCMLRECPIDHPCLRGLAPERVFDAVARMLIPPGQPHSGVDAR